MTYASDRMKEAFLSIIPQKTESALFFKSFISSTLINTSRINNNQKNFYDINPMSANHPLLIFTNLLEISSRIAINYLYENITKLSKDISFPNYMPIDLEFIELIVEVFQTIRFHYFKHFSYEGFVNMFNNTNLKECNGCFRLLNNTVEKDFDSDSSSEDEW